MSYPSGPPGAAGYPSGSPQPQFNAPTQQFGQPQEPAPAGPSKLPLYLAIAVAVLGLAVYLASFGPVFSITAPSLPGIGPIGGAVSATPVGITLATAISVLAALLAGVSLLPKQAKLDAWVAILSVLGVLLVLSQIVGVPTGVSFGWALYLIIALTLLQAITAVVGLLLDAGVITAPVPKPKYDAQYGQYGGPSPYYGQLPGQPQHGGQPHQQGPPQRPGYQPQYGGYSNGPSTGGFGAPQPPQGAPQTGPPTPPTGFPAFGQPQPAQPQSPAYEPAQPPYDSQQTTQQAAPHSAPPPS